MQKKDGTNISPNFRFMSLIIYSFFINRLIFRNMFRTTSNKLLLSDFYQEHFIQKLGVVTLLTVHRVERLYLIT